MRLADHAAFLDRLLERLDVRRRVVLVVHDWLGETRVPKLFVCAEPGQFLTGGPRELCRTWPNQAELSVPGVHFVQENAPDRIGAAIAAWLRELP
ncbi:hypothetical protein [Streptomyces sp. NBC_01198]|uniref:hypothetical protein n=1 Tax=Streptomyces sp. NBC_01198 TaxID=2903769 RepID=UPI002E116E9B|nr:hypothetical protein OG702_03450 [Streptomyces sp. NBC_01198]